MRISSGVNTGTIIMGNRGEESCVVDRNPLFRESNKELWDEYSKYWKAEYKKKMLSKLEDLNNLHLKVLMLRKYANNLSPDNYLKELDKIQIQLEEL